MSTIEKKQNKTKQQQIQGVDLMLWRSLWERFCLSFTEGKREASPCVLRAPKKEGTCIIFQQYFVGIKNTRNSNDCWNCLDYSSISSLAKYSHIFFKVLLKYS